MSGPFKTEVWLYDEETEIEMPVMVHYYRHPAEPDVGYPTPYFEWDCATLPWFGNVFIDLDDWWRDDAFERVMVDHDVEEV